MQVALLAEPKTPLESSLPALAQQGNAVAKKHCYVIAQALPVTRVRISYHDCREYGSAIALYEKRQISSGASTILSP